MWQLATTMQADHRIEEEEEEEEKKKSRPTIQTSDTDSDSCK